MMQDNATLRAKQSTIAQSDTSQSSTPVARASARQRAHPRRVSQIPTTLVIITSVVTLLILLPLAYLLVRAGGVGTRALLLLWQPRTLQVIGNSIMLAGLVTILSLLIALPLAWLTVRTDLPGRRYWSILTTLPLVFPSYVGSFALVAMMGPRGTLQSWLAPLGVERLPSIYGLSGAVLVLTLFTYPYLLLSIRAGLRNMDPVLEEAARNLGYNSWHTFWRVTLPHLRPSIIAGSLLVSLYVLSDFGAVSMLRFNSFTRAIYLQYSSSFDRSLAALLALVLVFLTIIVLLTAQRFRGKGQHYRASAGVARQRTHQPLGRWTWVGLLFCLLIVMVALVIPTSIVVFWLVRGLAAGESLLPVWEAIRNSVQAAGLAALVAVLLALPIAYLSTRYPGRFSLVVSQSVYIGYGLPGIVIALSLVFFGANYAGFLYQTLAMLIFAYTVRFLPQALGTVQASMLQISPRLEEASRSLGVSQCRTLWSITIPLLRPGIWTGAALVFLTTLKELPATLLLGPTGFTTLATQIWSATEEAFFARAAAPALLLLCVSAFSIGIILRQEERGRA